MAAADLSDKFVLPRLERQFFGPPLEEEEDIIAPSVFSKGDTRFGRIVELEPYVEKEEDAAAGGGFREVKDDTKAKALERQKRKEQTGGVNLPTRGRGRGGAMRGGRGANNRGGRGGRGGRGDSRAAHHQAIMADTVDISPDSHTILAKLDLEKLQKALKDEAKRDDAKGGAPSPVLSVTDLRLTGQCREYDAALDRATSRLPIPLRCFPDVSYGYKPVLDDPTIREIARSIPPGTTPVIVTSDLILATIMQAAKALRPWDVETTKLGRFVFLSERENNASQLETQWVGETMVNGPIDSADFASDINSATRLAHEATQIARFFSSQAQKTKMFPRPGATKSLVVESNHRPCFFRYRHFHMDDCDVLVRCEIDCATETAPGELEFLRVFSLLEMPSNMASVTESWRARLGESRGAIMAQEIKCNAAKIARWVTLAWLAGANMKVAFASRVDATKNDKHVLLAVDTKSSVDFAAQIGIRSNQLWKMLRAVTDMIFEKTPADNNMGTLVKVAGKHEIIFCQAIDEDDDEEEEEEDEEGDEDEDEDEDA